MNYINWTIVFSCVVRDGLLKTSVRNFHVLAKFSRSLGIQGGAAKLLKTLEPVSKRVEWLRLA